MTAIVIVAFAAHVIAWVALPTAKNATAVSKSSAVATPKMRVSGV